MALKPIENNCPYCDVPMRTTRMACSRCGVAVEAAFPTSRLANLPIEHQRFIEMFVLAGGSLKEIAELAGVSYPTVRSRLDKVIEVLREQMAQPVEIKGAVSDSAGQGEMTAEEAAKLIKGI